MNKIFSSAVLFYVQLLLFSFESKASEDVSQLSVSAEKQLLSAVFPKTCHFSGLFVQKKEIQGLAFPLQSSGDFLFSCDLGLIWNTTAPFNEALLYANAKTNYKVDEHGNIEEMSGTTRYVMSRFFLRLLNGDADYFAQEFKVTLTEDGSGTILTPESDFMKKGIEGILIENFNPDEKALSLNVKITDATGQATHITIKSIVEYSLDGRTEAYKQCKVLYPNPSKWCRLLRSPGYYMR